MANYQDARGSQGAEPTNDVKSRLIAGFGRILDAVEPQIDRAPANVQPAARKAVAVARARPLLTLAGLALGALVLTRGARRQ